MTDFSWVGELVKYGGDKLENIIPKVRKRAVGILTKMKHSDNWPAGLQRRDYELMSQAITVICDREAFHTLVDVADFSDVDVSSPETGTGICLALVHEQPECVARTLTLCVYAYMCGHSYIVGILLNKLFALTPEIREQLYKHCDTMTKAWRIEAGIPQWTAALKTDLEAWMYGHGLPIDYAGTRFKDGAEIKPEIFDAYLSAYDGDLTGVQLLIEQNTNHVPPGVRCLQFRHLSVPFEGELKKYVTEMLFGHAVVKQVMYDSEAWANVNQINCQIKVALSFPKKLDRKDLMLRYGCTFRMGFQHSCKACLFPKIIHVAHTTALLRYVRELVPSVISDRAVIMGCGWHPDVSGKDWMVSVYTDLLVHFKPMCEIMDRIGKFAFSQEVPLIIAGRLITRAWSTTALIGDWRSWFSFTEVGYNELTPQKSTDGIEWVNRQECKHHDETALLYTDSTPADWWVTAWPVAGVPSLRVRRGLVDIFHVPIRHMELDELVVVWNTVFAAKDGPSRPAVSLQNFLLGDFEKEEGSVVAVDGNDSMRAVVLMTALNRGFGIREISLSYSKQTCNGYRLYIDNAVMDGLVQYQSEGPDLRKASTNKKKLRSKIISKLNAQEQPAK